MRKAIRCKEGVYTVEPLYKDTPHTHCSIQDEGDVYTSGTSGCIPHPYIFVQLLQDSEA